MRQMEEVMHRPIFDHTYFWLHVALNQEPKEFPYMKKRMTKKDAEEEKKPMK